MREWGCYEQAKASVVEKKIEFAGRVWKPTRKLAYVLASMCHPLPTLNSKRRGFTAATLANSFETAAMQLCDFEHALEFYGAEKDEICGVIAAAEFPAKKKAIELAEAGEKVPMKVLFAVWRKAANAEAALEEMAGAGNPWSVSMECEFPREECALWDGKAFTGWNECSSEMQALVKSNTVEKFGGTAMALIMGGVDGQVLFTGGAFTKWPADKTAGLEQMAASDRSLLSMGWKSQADWQQAVASQKPLAKPVDEKGSLVIGRTRPGGKDGHTHEITRNLQILPANGHSHYFTPVDFDPSSGSFEGLTSTTYGYFGSGLASEGDYGEHCHKVELGGDYYINGLGSIKVPQFNIEELKQEKIRAAHGGSANAKTA